MPVYRLPEAVVFPPVDHAAKSGLLAVGGDLSPERLLAAYREGIFPWYGDGEPILWWSPDPRFVLFPDELRVSRSMRQFLKKGIVRITFDQAFPEVIATCRRPRPGQGGTWITPEMRDAYADLHRAGHAHSVEAWRDGELVGGLYGVSLGGAFFGESMFGLEPEASRAALAALDTRLAAWRFTMLDGQVPHEGLVRYGFQVVPRSQFLAELAGALRAEGREGSWSER